MLFVEIISSEKDFVKIQKIDQQILKNKLEYFKICATSNLDLDLLNLQKYLILYRVILENLKNMKSFILLIFEQ